MQIWKQLKNTLTNKDSLTYHTLKGYGFSAINYKIKNMKNKLMKTELEQAAEKYSENWEEITGLDYENVVPSEVNKLDFINGAKWQQEQNKNLYSEEDLLNFGAFVRIEDKKEKRLFLIQDYFKKWFEQFSKLKNG